MTKISRQIRIDAPKSKVWDILADLGGIQAFNPAVKKSYYTTDQRSDVGAGRACELLPMGKVEENVLEWRDGEGYTLAVVPIEKAPPLKHAEGRFDLEADGEATVVRFQIEYKLKFGPIGRLMDAALVKSQFSKVVPGILEGLKHYAETGEEVDRDVLKRIRAQGIQAQPIYA